MREGLVAVVLTNFSEDAPPVPLKLVVLAGAQQVEHDATETKFCELILHKASFLIQLLSNLSIRPRLISRLFVNLSTQVRARIPVRTANRNSKKFAEVGTKRETSIDGRRCF